jgi:DNA polymerase-3 subunit gamma/tau
MTGAPAAQATSGPAAAGTESRSVAASPTPSEGHGPAAGPGHPVDRSDLGEASGDLDAAAVRRVWDDVLSVVRRHSPRAWAVIREATVRDVHGDELVLVFQHLVHLNMFGAQVPLLVEAVGEILGGRWRVRAEAAVDAGTPPTGSPVVESYPADPPPAPRAATATSDDDWPAPARPGGVPTASTQPDPSAGVGTGSTAVPARSTRSDPASRSNRPTGAEPTGPAHATPGTREGTTPAASTRAGTGTKRPTSTRAAGATTRSTSAPVAGGGPRAAAAPDATAIDSFDPGDEPLDDAGTMLGQTSEERAIAVLTNHFVAEPIGEKGV